MAVTLAIYNTDIKNLSFWSKTFRPVLEYQFHPAVWPLENYLTFLSLDLKFHED